MRVTLLAAIASSLLWGAHASAQSVPEGTVKEGPTLVAPPATTGVFDMADEQSTTGEPSRGKTKGEPKLHQPGPVPPGAAAPTPPPPMPWFADDKGSKSASGPSGVLLYGDVFWMRPRRTAPFVFHTTPTAGFGEDYDTTEFHFGFRAGGGYLTSDGLLLAATYTHFEHQVADDSEGVGSFTYVGPGLLHGSTADSLRGTWNFRYRTVDIHGGVVLSPTDHVDLILTGGARIAWIDQAYETFLTNGGIGAVELHDLTLGGAGPRFGSEGRIYLLPWLALYGQGAASLIFADLRNDSELNVSGPNETSRFVLRYDRHHLIPALELAVGAEVSLFKGRVLLGGGYEYHYWFNLANSVDNGGNIIPSDLSLEGVFVRATLLW